MQLSTLFILHFVIGWIYLFISPLFLPRVAESAAPKTNPFTKKPQEKPAPASDKNPFKGN